MAILIANAKTLSTVATDSSNTESQQLFQLLRDHGVRRFAQRNGYNYNGNATSPPDMFEHTQDRVRSADVLCFPDTRDLNHISAYVRANILKYLCFIISKPETYIETYSAMHLPEWLSG